jgi:hypothetical protein
MNAAPQRARPWQGFLLSQALGLVSVALCCWWMARQNSYLLANHRVTGSLNLHESFFGTTAFWQLVEFAAALAFVHALLGASAFGLARLTEAAFPGREIARRRWLVGGWFALLAGLAMAANTTWHQSSIFAGEDSWWRRDVAGLPPAAIAAGLLNLLIAILAIRALPRLRPPRPRHTLAFAAGAAVLALAFVLPAITSASAGSQDWSKPHIVILGIDSLRNDLTVPRHGEAQVPNVRGFLAQSRRFEDATTSLARTYPSWMTILTGRHPVDTNARYNLMPRKLVHEGETIGESLHAQGYRSIYATDEVRFANFDRSFGFDEVITPPVGASDFLLGYVGDMPLVNLVADLPFGGALFPSNHANRAANVTYRPAHFLRRLDRELAVEGPSFISIHLTLAHWPYAWAGMHVPTAPEEYRQAYAAATAEVDRQFGEVLKLLAGKGVLDNAIVVLLSDHGEALGADDDSIIRGSGSSREIWDSLWGHGTSVLSPNQYRVLLAMRAFGRAKLPGPDENYDWPVSLEDLRPTLEQLATGRVPAGVDGLSLVPYMAEPASAKALATRIRFTETDFNTLSTLEGHYQASGLVDEAAVYYEMDPASGWMQLRPSRLPGLIAEKQRAAIGSGSLVAFIPGREGQADRYLFADRQDPHPRALEGPLDGPGNAEAKRLRDALLARFPGEVKPPGDLPRM